MKFKWDKEDEVPAPVLSTRKSLDRDSIELSTLLPSHAEEAQLSYME